MCIHDDLPNRITAEILTNISSRFCLFNINSEIIIVSVEKLANIDLTEKKELLNILLHVNNSFNSTKILQYNPYHLISQ